jgi:hypothetical protein
MGEAEIGGRQFRRGGRLSPEKKQININACFYNGNFVYLQKGKFVNICR